MKKLFFILILSTTLFLPPKAVAENTDRPDSILSSYHRLCLTNMRQPEVLPICDTLFQLAAERKDLSMQSTALAFTVDYYYSQNNLDSLMVWMQRSETFAREHNVLKPFYFAWDELIMLYIKTAQYALAQYEIEKLIRQAEKDDYKSAIGSAYYNLGTIYRLKEVSSTAIEHYRKAINYILQNDLDRYTLPNIYSQLATVLASIGEYEQALEAVDLSAQYTSAPIKTALLEDAQRAEIYAQMGNTKKALELLQSIEQQKSTGLLPQTSLLKLQTTVYQNCGMHIQALTSIDNMMDEYRKRGHVEIYYSNLIENRAHIYADMGDFKKAYEDLRDFTKLYKEKVSKEGESTLAEFATLMGVEQLNQEKAAMEVQRNRSVIIALVCILILAGIFIFVQRRLNQRLTRAMLAAKEANQMKSVFIRNITHEVNTPLNAIVGFTELLISTPADDPERQGYIDIIHENSDYLQKLVDDTLYISDLESTGKANENATADINECLTHAMRNVNHLDKKEIEIQLQLLDPPVTICAPKQYIIKVITELMHNALTYTSSGHIKISGSVDAKQNQLTLSVTDTGPGIPAGEHERIFERFVKLNNFAQGMGLGLSVCRIIARHLGGEVRLDTTHTEGARFLFTLPLNSKKH